VIRGLDCSRDKAPVKYRDEAWIQGPGNACVGPSSAFSLGSTPSAANVQNDTLSIITTTPSTAHNGSHQESVPPGNGKEDFEGALQLQRHQEPRCTGVSQLYAVHANGVERGSNRLQGLWGKNNYADKCAEGDRGCASQVQELREAALLLPIINMAPNLTIMTSRRAATTSLRH
ncbi:hypothetical protein BN1723_012749, partial [Verticillium longisporum]